MVVEVPPYQISHVHYAGNLHLNIMENQFIKELLLLHLDELISFKINVLEKLIELLLKENSELEGYTYKEYLIDEYNDLINYLDPSLHTDAVINNINSFAKEGSVAKYVDGKIVIYVGEAKGNSIKGELKKNSCDTSNVRIKFFFTKFFFNK